MKISTTRVIPETAARLLWENSGRVDSDAWNQSANAALRHNLLANETVAAFRAGTAKRVEVEDVDRAAKAAGLKSIDDAPSDSGFAVESPLKGRHTELAWARAYRVGSSIYAYLFRDFADREIKQWYRIAGAPPGKA